jgi:hypothetical protein
MPLDTQGTNEVKISVSHRCENVSNMDEKFSKDRFLQKKETEMLEMKSSIENSWKVSPIYNQLPDNNDSVKNWASDLS